MSVKNSIIFITLFSIIAFACNSSLNKIFVKQTPHEAYADAIKKDSLGEYWVDVSKKALVFPQVIELPYSQVGYFHPDKPRALALRFTAKRGEWINFELNKKAGHNFTLFADLYRMEASGQSHLLSVDTTSTVFGFDVEEGGDYMLRLQPELYRTGEYSLSAVVGPSLGFPVAGEKARAGSFWGADRDGGKRSHEGIDIFAPKLTPAVASADGYITRVTEGGIGGKTVWMRTSHHDIYLYYAHLDSQLVQEGQQVNIGDTLGLVGNTGNAKYTPPHLHFGIYTSQGPIDPFPFVNKVIKSPPAIKSNDLSGYLKLKPAGRTKAVQGVTDSLITPLAFSHQGYIGEKPDGSLVKLAAKDVIYIKAGDDVKERPGSSGG